MPNNIPLLTSRSKIFFSIILVILFYYPLDGYSQSKNVNDFIRNLNDKDPQNRFEAARSLGEVRDVKAVVQLIDTLKDEIEYVRGEAARSLGRIRDARAIAPLILMLSNDDNAFARKSALIALAAINGKDHIDHIISALNDKDIMVRSEAPKILGEMKDTRAIPALINIMDQSDIRKLAEDALVNMGSPAVKILVSELISRSDRGAIGPILAKIGKPSMEPLIGLLKHKNSEVRATAVSALGEMSDKGVVVPLINVLSDKDASVRMSAARALEHIKDPRIIVPLINVLKDKDEFVRMSAARALEHIKDPRVTESLVSGLKRKDLAIMAGAYSFFIWRGEFDSVPILINTLKKYNDMSMAEAFINSGNSKLEEKGFEWAKTKGYMIMQKYDRNTSPTWGSNR